MLWCERRKPFQESMLNSKTAIFKLRKELRCAHRKYVCTRAVLCVQRTELCTPQICVYTCNSLRNCAKSLHSKYVYTRAVLCVQRTELCAPQICVHTCNSLRSGSAAMSSVCLRILENCLFQTAQRLHSNTHTSRKLPCSNRAKS